MAFLRRKGNSYYLVHNVRQRGRVKQLHLARLGDRPRITSDVIREVSRNYPLLALDWEKVRGMAHDRVEIFRPDSEFVRKLVSSLQSLNLDLADLSPALVEFSEAPATGNEIVQQLRLLRSILDVKLGQFDRAEHPGLSAGRRFR